MYNLEIRKCTSPNPPSSEVGNFQMKIYYSAGIDPGPAEPEAHFVKEEINYFTYSSSHGSSFIILFPVVLQKDSTFKLCKFHFVIVY